MSDDDLIAKYDKVDAGVVTVHHLIQPYIQEFRHRDQLRVAQSVEKFTKRILWLTFIVTLATAVNVAFMVGLFFRQ